MNVFMKKLKKPSNAIINWAPETSRKSQTSGKGYICISFRQKC